MRLKTLLASAAIGVTIVAGLVVPTAASASATPVSPGSVGPKVVNNSVSLVTYWTIANQGSNANAIDFSRPVGRCYSGGGGVCTITRGQSVGTTVTTALGWSASGIAANIGVNLSASSSTSVSCQSPVMSAGQSYVGYSIGTYHYYIVDKWQTSSSPVPHNPTLVGQSGWLGAFQPYTYPAIYCRVE